MIALIKIRQGRAPPDVLKDQEEKLKKTITDHQIVEFLTKKLFPSFMETELSLKKCGSGGGDDSLGDYKSKKSQDKYSAARK